MSIDLEQLVHIDGPYRNWLRRNLAEKVTKRALFLMLNPSKAGQAADALATDPTDTRCSGFAKREGCDAYGIVNMFALRATEPEEMWGSGLDRVGPHNDFWIAAALEWADVVICAWGARPQRSNARAVYATRVREVSALIAASGKPPFVLGFTDRGEPRHPLYVKGASPLQPYVLGRTQSPTGGSAPC